MLGWYAEYSDVEEIEKKAARALRKMIMHSTRQGGSLGDQT